MRTLTYSCNHRTLRSHAAPLWSRFSIAKLKPPDRNSLEKTSVQREAESRAAPCTQNEIAKRIEARCSYEMNLPAGRGTANGGQPAAMPAAGAAHAVDAA